MSLELNLRNLVQRIANEVKALRTLINGNQSDLSSLATVQKANLVAALNELKTEIDILASSEGGATINDGSPSTAYVWSSSKTSSEISAAIDALVDGAPGLLDTLEELSAALGDDPNFAATTATALGNRVRVDINNQGLTTEQQGNARTNIGAAAASHTHVATDITSGTIAAARLPAASESAVGAVELATTTEVASGVDTARAITPAGLRSVTGDPEYNLVTVFEANL